MLVVINLKSTRDPVESLLPALLILRREEPSLIGYYLSKDCFHVVFGIDNQVTPKKYFSDLKATHQDSFQLLGLKFDSGEKYQNGGIKSIEILLDLYFGKILADNSSPRRTLTQELIADTNSYEEFLGKVGNAENTSMTRESIIDKKILQYLLLVRMVDLARHMDITALTVEDLVLSAPVFESASTTRTNERATTIIVLTAHATHLNSITSSCTQKLLEVLAHYKFKPSTEVEVGPVGVSDPSGSGDLVIAVRAAIPTQQRTALEMSVFNAIQGRNFNGGIALTKVIYLNQEPVTHANPYKIDQHELQRTITKFNADMIDGFFGERAEGVTPFKLPAPLYPRLILKLGTLPVDVSTDFANRYYHTVLREHFLKLDVHYPETLVSRMMLFSIVSIPDKHAGYGTLLNIRYFDKISNINLPTDLHRELQIICQICCYATPGADRSNILTAFKTTVKTVLNLGPGRLKNYDAIAFRLAELYFSRSSLALLDIKKLDTSGLILFADLIDKMKRESFERLYLVAWVSVISLPLVDNNSAAHHPGYNSPEDITCFDLATIIQKLAKNKWHHLLHLQKLLLELRFKCSLEKRRELVITYKPIYELHFSKLSQDEHEKFIGEQLKSALLLATSAKDDPTDNTAAFKFLADCCCLFLESLPTLRFIITLDIFLQIVIKLLALNFVGDVEQYYSYLERIRLLFARFDALNADAVTILYRIENILMYRGIPGNSFRDFVNCVIHKNQVGLFNTNWKIHSANWYAPLMAIISHNFGTFLKFHRLGHSLCFKDRPYQLNPAVRALVGRPDNTNSDVKLILKYLEDKERYKEFNDGTTLAHMKAYQGDTAYFETSQSNDLLSEESNLETNQSKYFVTDDHGISPTIIFLCFHLNTSNILHVNANLSTLNLRNNVNISALQKMKDTLINRINSPKPLNQQRAILALSANFIKQITPGNLCEDVARAMLGAFQSIPNPSVEDMLFEIQIRLEFLCTEVFSGEAKVECGSKCQLLISELVSKDGLPDEIYSEVFRWLFDMEINMKARPSSISSLVRLNLMRDVVLKIKNKSQNDYQSLLKIGCQIAEHNTVQDNKQLLVNMLMNCLEQVRNSIETASTHHETDKCVFMVLIYTVRNYTQLNERDIKFLLNLQRSLISAHTKITPRSEGRNVLFLEAISHIFIALVRVIPNDFTEPANTLTVIITWINRTGILVDRHAEMIIDGIAAAVDSNCEFSASDKEAIEQFKSILKLQKSDPAIQKLLKKFNSLKHNESKNRKPKATPPVKVQPKPEVGLVGPTVVSDPVENERKSMLEILCLLKTYVFQQAVLTLDINDNKIIHIKGIQNFEEHPELKSRLDRLGITLSDRLVKIVEAEPEPILSYTATVRIKDSVYDEDKWKSILNPVATSKPKAITTYAVVAQATQQARVTEASAVPKTDTTEIALPNDKDFLQLFFCKLLRCDDSTIKCNWIRSYPFKDQERNITKVRFSISDPDAIVNFYKRKVPPIKILNELITIFSRHGHELGKFIDEIDLSVDYPDAPKKQVGFVLIREVMDSLITSPELFTKISGAFKEYLSNLPTDYQTYRNEPTPALFTPKPSNENIATTLIEKGWLRRLFIDVKNDSLLHAGLAYHFKELEIQIQLLKIRTSDAAIRSLQLRAYALHLFSLINLISDYADSTLKDTNVAEILNKLRNYIRHGILAIDMQNLFNKTFSEFLTMIELFNLGQYATASTEMDNCEKYFTKLSQENIPTLSPSVTQGRYNAELQHLNNILENEFLEDWQLIDIAMSCTILRVCMNGHTQDKSDFIERIKEISAFVGHSKNNILRDKPQSSDYCFEVCLRTLIEPLQAITQTSHESIMNSR